MKTNRRSVLTQRIAPAAFALFSITATASAQIASTEFSAAYLGVGDFDTTVGLSALKEYYGAWNLGSGANVTVNGVTFTGVGGSNPTVAGNFTTSGMGTVFGSGGPNPGGQLGLLTTDFVYGSAAQVVNLTNLTAGESYVVTFYSSSWEGAGNRRQTMSATGSASGLFEYDQNMGAPGQGHFNVLRYTFTAGAAAHAVNFNAVVAANTMHQYGFSVERVFNNTYVSGADWNTASWGAAGVPNGQGRSAAFASAGAPTSIALDAPVTIGHLQFDNGANAFTINGSGANTLTLLADVGGVSTLVSKTAGANHTINSDIALQNKLLKTGAGQVTINGNITAVAGANMRITAGTLTLNGTSTHRGETIINNGAVLEVTSLGDYGVASGIGARQLADENLTVTGVGLHMAGGILRFVGSTPQSTNRHIRFINGVNGGIEANGTNPAATVSFTQSGPNINLFDTGGTRTINLGGANTGNNLFALQIINQGASATSVTKYGLGTWELSGVSSYTGITTVQQGTLILSGARTANSGGITVANITGQSGTLNIQNGTYTVGGTFTVAQGDASVQGTVNQTGGSLTLSGTQMIVGNGSGSQGFYNLSAGTLTGAASGNRGVILGTNTGTQGTFNLSGTGNLNLATAALQVARSENTPANTTTGIFNQTGGTATVGTLGVGGLTPAQNFSSVGTMNLTGGTFTATGFNAFGGGDNSTATINIGGTALVTLPAFPTARGTGATTTVTFDGGTLRAGVSSATYMENLTAAQIKNGGLNFDSNGQTVTINQPITDFAGHTGTFTKLGAGTLILGGASTYTGATNVNAGTLLVSGSIGNTSVTVASGATFGGTGTVAGAVSVASGGHIAPGASVGTLTIGSLVLSSGAILDYEFNPVSDLIVITAPGGLTINGGGFNLYNEGGITPFSTNGTYTLLDYNTAFTGSIASFSVLNAQAGKFYSIADNVGATTIELTIADAIVTEWNGAGGDGLWTTGPNWTGGSPNTPGIVARFGTIPGSPTPVAVNGPKTVGAIIFDNANSYTVTGGAGDAITFDNGAGAGALSVLSGSHTLSAPLVLMRSLNIERGAGTSLALLGNISAAGNSLILGGSGTLTLTGTNNYDTTVINGGTLAVGTGGTTGTLGSGTVTLTPGATLLLNRSNDQTYAMNITGAGTLEKQGAGTATLGGSNSFQSLTLTQGTLLAGAAGALPAGLAIGGTGGTLDLNGFNASASSLTGAATITDNAGSVGATTLNLSLTGTNSFTGLLQNGPSRTLNVAINSGTLSLDRAGDHTISASLTGPGTLAKTGTGITTLSGTNSVTTLNLDAGTIRAGSSSALNVSGTAAINGVLDLDDHNATVGGLTGTTGAITTNGITPGTSTFTVNQAANTSFDGTLSDGATRQLALVKTGTGILTLGGIGANTTQGGVTITHGTLRLQKTSGNAITGPVTIGDANGSDVLELGGNDQISDSSVLTFTAGGAGNSAFFRINGFNDTVRGITSTLANAAVIENNDIANGTAILTVDTQGGDFAYDGIVRNASVGTSIFALTKSGTGTLTLRNTAAVAPNSYTGATTINDGRLILDDLSGMGATAVAINSAAAGAFTIATSTRNLSTGLILGGTGEFVKDGPLTLTLTGPSSFAGKSIINDGTLGLGNNNVLGTSEIVMNGGTIRAAGAGRTLFNPVTVNGSFTLGRLTNLLGSITLTTDATITANNPDGPANNPSDLGPIAGNFRISFAEGPQGIGVGSLNITSTNSNTGGTEILSGRVTVTPSGALPNASLIINGGEINLNNAVQTVSSLSGTGGTMNLGPGHLLLISQAANTTFAGFIGGTGSLEKDLGGTLTLSGASGYSGTTTVSQGILNVSGSINGSTVTVNPGGTLAGTGSTGPVTSLGGTLAPGASPGTLTVASLALDSASDLNFELSIAGIVGSGVNDLLQIGGDLTLDGTLNITTLPGFGNGTYRIANYGGTLTDSGLDLTSAFLTAYPGSFVDTTSIGEVNLQVVPEPGSALLLIGGLALLARRRREA